MAKNSDIERLRADVRKAHRSTTNKISRLKRINDVEVSGTAIDPRRNPKVIGRYTRAQLLAYQAQLQAFNSRRTQYLRGARGTIVSKELFSEFERTKRRVNERNEREFARIAGIQLPRSAQTIEQRLRMLVKPAGYLGVDLPATRPFDIIGRSNPRGLMGDKGVRTQIAAMQSRLDPNWIHRKVERDRESFKKMAQIINKPALATAVDKLSSAQFNVLWNYTDFSNSVSLHYENMKSMLQGRDEAWYDQIGGEVVDEAHALIEWASSLNLGR
jgi:hypothetical protein